MRRIVKIVSALLVLALLCGGALAASYDARVLSSSMKVYNRTSSSRQVIGSLGRKTRFTVTKIDGDWAKISYKGHTGYARMKDIIFDDSIEAKTTRSTSLRFVTEESYDRGVYYKATIAKNTTVYVVGLKGDEALITNASGSALGYVRLSALEKK